METKQNIQKQAESDRVNLCGLWVKEGKDGMWSGKVNEKVVIEEGEYINMFLNSNSHAKAPAYNLVIYRGTKKPQQTFHRKNEAELLYEKQMEKLAEQNG